MIHHGRQDLSHLLVDYIGNEWDLVGTSWLHGFGSNIISFHVDGLARMDDSFMKHAHIYFGCLLVFVCVILIWASASRYGAELCVFSID